ncbi:phostensin [Spea bombifrons]|uniref:phostensin n=1 Tax=Spea bombifrons TaxID=233779 RepID=UPI00234BC15E|nr:phostensin [Spea bombifrons]
MMEVPDWKFHLLERRRRDEEGAKKREREEEDRLAKMPQWKREIILRRKAKAEASMTDNRLEVEEGEHEEKEKVDIGEKEEIEPRVLMEKIGPVQQNPFIQLEKQRRMPELNYTRPKPSPEPTGLRSLRVDDMARESHPTNMEEEQRTPLEDPSPLNEERKGRVSRLLSRFGRSWVEGDNSGPAVSLINGEGEVTTKAPCPLLKAAEHDIKAPSSFAEPAPPSPSCLRAVTGNQTLTQETTLSSLTPSSSSPSCADSEPAVHSPSVALAAMSGLSVRPSMAEETRSFPFQLRPASPASQRPLKQSVQTSPPLARPEVSKNGTGQTEEDGVGGPAISKTTSLSQGNKMGMMGESQAMQRRKGNTITVNPRKMNVCENGVVATESKSLPLKNESGKKRYPTVDEIKVIGGYQALSKSCLAKHSRDRKKLSISFPECELESTYEYPSESSLMAEFGPPDETEPLMPPPQPEEDEEEDSILLGGIMRRKALIVGESLKNRSPGSRYGYRAPSTCGSSYLSRRSAWFK